MLSSDKSTPPPLIRGISNNSTMSSSGNINDIYDDSDLLDYDDSNNENDHDNDDESYNNNYNYTTGHHSKQPLTTDRSTMSSPTTSRSVTATPTVDNRRRTIFPHNKGSNNGNGNYSSSYRSKLSVATPLRKGAGTSGSFYDGNDNGNRNGNGNGSISNNAPSPPPQTYSPPKSPKRDKPQNRKTKIQVCVRVRPILPSDHKKGPSGPSSPNRHKSDLLPPTSDGKRATVKAKSSRHMSLSSAPNTPNSTPNKKGSNGSGGRNSNNNKNNHNNRSRSSSRDRKDIIDTEPAWAVKNNNVSQALHTNPDMARTNDYTFDHTFGPKDDTHQMYQSAVQDCVLSTMEGYHASVFAYGQTATGKTYTMSGKGGMKNYNPDNPSSQGIIQLAIDDCFNYIYNQKSDTREYLLRVSFMEIYNEVINDLLASPPPGKHTTFSSSAMNSPPPAAPSTIRIFESKNEGVIIRGLKEEIVTCSEQVYALLAAGERRRQTGSTILNKQSSRSHSIFRLIVESRRRVPRQQVLSMPSDASSVAESIASSTFAPETTTGKVRVSTLSLVDLAGSESVKNTGSTGVRQKEGQYINKSLLTLGHVIYKLAEMSTKNKSIDEMHIPYRDSKLTRLLQPSLSGNAQICIICNVSPLAKHVEESHLTLKFAMRAKRIKQNATITEVMDEKTMLDNYREEIEELKRQLKEANDNKTHSTTLLSIDASDGEDATVISQAISNLERLILKTQTAEEKKRKKERRERMKARNKFTEGGIDDEGMFEIPANVGKDMEETFGTLLTSIIDDDDELLTSMSLTSKEKMPQDKDDHSIDESLSLGDNSTIYEGPKLVSELHRIRGLLGNVLERKATSGVKSNAGTPVKTNNLSSSSNNTQEVERLRAQLHEQAVTTSLRRADSTFLQSQLQEKDKLLTDVSQILEVVEKRQVELEADNEKLKQEYTKSIAALKSKESEVLILEKLMKKRETEIKRLKTLAT